MYLFYLDESGSRDPSAGTPENPKDHIYVLLAVGMYERQWRPFDIEVSQLKLGLADRLWQEGVGLFDLADCEVKSNWLRNPNARSKESKFLESLNTADIENIASTYFQQVRKRKAVILASVIDKRCLYAETNSSDLHRKAYEFLLERIQHYMRQYRRNHQAIIIMDDTSKQLNRMIAMQHASFQRTGNWNMAFPNIVEYPFFVRSELSNGIQLADQLAYNVYRAFRYDDLNYTYFGMMLENFYKSRDRAILHGLKVWPENSPLVERWRRHWEGYKRTALRREGG